jgi:2-succinyl-6-hydroxy-2,4-cyclohexadiene-1-carboxylate synthase
VPEALVLLHGFAQTHRTWDGVLARLEPETYRPFAVDLRGHGAARAARPITFHACVGDVLAAAPPTFALAGYSMGARLALHVALAAPDRITRLILVSGTAGIDDPAERAQRRARDEALAARIERGTIEEFATAWRAQPLFSGDPPEVARLARADYVRNDPHALAAALRGIGTGVMEPLWERLPGLTMPATLLAGERDGKFVALGERLAAALPQAQLNVVTGAGHAVHLQEPDAVVRAAQGPTGH